MLTAFKEGQDIHTATGAKIFDVAPWGSDPRPTQHSEDG
jgi:DNA polymerase I-like protein with 3'-5' exonuclease and polymerase domains